jgi:hypothetical protein
MLVRMKSSRWPIGWYLAVLAVVVAFGVLDVVDRSFLGSFPGETLGTVMGLGVGLAIWDWHTRRLTGD